MTGLRADIRKNLEREVKARLIGRNKQAALEALVAKAHEVCPYSNATRNNVPVRLVVA